MRAAYIGWLGHGNIGDEIIFHSIKSLCGEVIDLVDNEKLSNWSDIVLVILGGGTIFHMGKDSRTNLLVKANSIGIPIMTWGSGVVTEPVMKDKLHVMPEDLRTALNEALIVSVRGPLSKKMLEENNFSRSVVTGDPALVYKYEEYSKNTKSDFSSKTIGINIGDTKNNLIGFSEDYVVSEVSKLTRMLLDEKFEVVLFSMWEPDAKFLHLVRDMPGCKMAIVKPYTDNIDNVLKFMSNCLMVIGMKLHSIVMSAVVNTPFISLAYRDKCKDFCDSLDIETEQVLVYTDSENLCGEVFEMVKKLKDKDFAEITMLEKIRSFKKHYFNMNLEIVKLLKELRD